MFVCVNEIDTVNIQRVFSTHVGVSVKDKKKFQVSFFGDDESEHVRSYEFETELEAKKFLKVCITEGARRDLKEFSVTSDGKVIL